MSRRSKPIDFEARAAEARAKRIDECANEVNEVLEKHRCQFLIIVQVGEVAKPLAEVLGLPAQMQVVTK